MWRVLCCAAALVLTAGRAEAGEFTASSRDLGPGGVLKEEQVLNSFGCTGKNMSPQIGWKNAPAGTKSFAVTIYDPDAPTGSGWWHWMVYDIPANVAELPTGAGDPAKGLAPAGSVQVDSDAGAPGYCGACPPKGDKPHRYIVTVFALKTDKLGAPANATAAMVGFFIHSQVIGRATFTARYGR